ncbi:N-acetyltransferase family 8 member 3-like [Polypterus senegalus]
MPVEEECDASDFQVRVFEPKDYPAVKRLFIDGIMEGVTPAFKEALPRSINLTVLAGIAAVTYVLPGHLRWLGVVVATAWIATVYWCCHMFYAIYVNDKLASEMKDIEKHFLSSPGNCYWVAEHKKLKVIGGMVAVKSCAGASKKDIITPDRKNTLSKSTPANIIPAQEEMGDECPLQNNAQSDTSHHKAECQDTAESCEMFRMIVDRQYRRHGLGVRLTQTVLDFAQKRGYKKCVLGTSKAQKAAQKLYLKVGFQLIKIITLEIGRFINVLSGAKVFYFEKQL